MLPFETSCSIILHQIKTTLIRDILFSNMLSTQDLSYTRLIAQNSTVYERNGGDKCQARHTDPKYFIKYTSLTFDTLH